MRSDQVVDEIVRLAAGRFECERTGDRIASLCRLAAADLEDRAAVLLRRQPGAGARTLLVVCGAGGDTMRAGLSWAAEVRDVLPEPEPADLYLLMDVACEAVVAERLEADDRLCRRHVTRVGEVPEDMFARTFLALAATPTATAPPDDPLAAALAAVQTTGQMTQKSALVWRDLLLSGLTGGSLADQLLLPVPEE